jgi:hypothetical protein
VLVSIQTSLSIAFWVGAAAYAALAGVAFKVLELMRREETAVSFAQSPLPAPVPS